MVISTHLNFFSGVASLLVMVGLSDSVVANREIKN